MRADDFAPFERLLSDLRTEQLHEPGNAYPRPLGAIPAATFPRAAAIRDPRYINAYRIDSKQAMRRWLAQTLDTHEIATLGDAMNFAAKAAWTELQRELHDAESSLLVSVIRDYYVAHLALQRQIIRAMETPR